MGVRDPKDGAKLPSHLPFSLYVDPATATVRATITENINAALELAYELGSMLSTPLGQGALASDRMMEFITGLETAFHHNMTGKRFLEIGCGQGKLLNELKKRGALITGLEIGPQGEEAVAKYGIEVVSKPLRPDLFSEPFDCILSYGTLEHIVELEEFLETCRNTLVDGGLFFHSVPNLESTYSQFAVDDLCHEHVSYFTPESARRLFDANGFSDSQAVPTKAGNELHVWGYRDVAAQLSQPGNNEQALEKEELALQNFANGLNARLENGKREIQGMLDCGETIGFYAGGYAFAELCGFSDKIQFYDGDPEKQGKIWLQGLSPIRSPADLVANLPDHVVICREHYSAAIRQNLIFELGVPESVQFHELATLCSQDSHDPQ